MKNTTESTWGLIFKQSLCYRGTNAPGSLLVQWRKRKEWISHPSLQLSPFNLPVPFSVIFSKKPEHAPSSSHRLPTSCNSCALSFSLATSTGQGPPRGTKQLTFNLLATIACNLCQQKIAYPGRLVYFKGRPPFLSHWQGIHTKIFILFSKPEGPFFSRVLRRNDVW